MVISKRIWQLAQEQLWIGALYLVTLRLCLTHLGQAHL